MKILKQSDSPLLNRKRITFTIDHTSKPTPSKSEITKQIAQDQKIKEECIALRHIYNHFGSSQSKVIAHIYKDKKTLDNLEPKKYHKKEEKAEVPKEETAKPTEEVKSEEKKEEKPKEETQKEVAKEDGKEKTNKE